MQNTVLSKEEFIEIINDLKEVSDYHQGLNKFFRDHNVDGYIFQPDCSCSVIRLLHLIFGPADTEEWIEKYCFTLNYGRKWKTGMFMEEYGTDIRLSAPEELYSLLTGERSQEE